MCFVNVNIFTRNCCEGRISEAKVYVDEQLCGEFEADAKVSTLYTVTCTTRLYGSTVKIVAREGVPLQFAEIEVYGSVIVKQCSLDN